ncbi:heat shock protein 21 [Penaeus vannamei]|uniref:Heat shock protein 21 n=1 Tax=Penaeus vannamei TaxID=6689 RepID=A0A423SDP0_PENVA|nr:heat shock protein 21 [Penaeus vannamei]
MASSDDVGLSRSSIKCRRCAGSPLSSWDLFLPITRRGSFFQDSFFSNIHHDFDAAIREVLGRWNEPDLKMEKSYDVTVSSTPAEKCSRQARSSSRAWGVFLPISRRGSFFQDAFFSDTHKDFDSSVREVLARWSGDDFQAKDFRREDIMDRYRQLRSRNLKEENQAVTVTSDKISHKVLDEEELLVEGHVERKEEGSLSVSSHSFRRYFSLPRHTDMAAITSVLSTDGILTITAPKMFTAVRGTLSCPSLEGETSSRTHSSPVYTAISTPPSGKVLNGWNDADLQLADRLGRYRQLRSRNLWSDNQAVTVTSDNISYKIVLDMHDFVDGDVKVKLMGEKELLVEALSAGSSRTFRRSFSLPESLTWHPSRLSCRQMASSQSL